MELLNFLAQYVIIPVVGLIVYMLNRQNVHHTEIERIKDRQTGHKDAHDKEITEVRRGIDGIFRKLDDIETYLRK